MSGEETTREFLSWGAERMNFGSYLNYTARLTYGTSGSSVIALIDSGVYPHSMIVPKMPVLGRDLVDNDDDPTNDLYGHGTHVAGIITDCTFGLPVYIYPIRVLNANGGGKMGNVVNAIEQATMAGADIINLSLQSDVVSEALDTKIRDALAAGITVVSAAGNSNKDTANIYPAHMTEHGMIVVGSAVVSGETISKASYSNYGESVDVYAFGSSINSCSNTGGFTLKTGTSMAAPHISSIASMLHLLHPGITPADIEYRIVSASDVFGNLLIPDLTSLFPVSRNFLLHTVNMICNDTLTLPSEALPAETGEQILYESLDPSVVAVDGSTLTALQEGTTVIVVSCTGLDTVTFTVNVLDGSENHTLILPDVLSELSDEAFRGDSQVYSVVLPDMIRTIGDYVFEECNSLSFIKLPSLLASIGRNTFSDAVILCEPATLAHQYAVEYGLQYIAR